MNSLTNIATNGVAGFMEDLTLVRIPPWWQSPWFLVLALVVLVALGFVARRLYLRRRRLAPVSPNVASGPSDSPETIALRTLEALRLQMAELGPYRLTIECSLVLRVYIEARFRLAILYQTTREFLDNAQTHSALSEEQRRSLGEYLRFCDLVKFARRGASKDEMVQLVDTAIAFVKTCSQPVQAANAPSGSAAKS